MPSPGWQGLFGSGDFAEFGDAANLDPLDDENVAVVIEIGAVRGDEFARSEMVAGLIADADVGGAVAELDDELVVFVEEGDAGFEVGDDHELAVGMKVARGAKVVGDEPDVLAVEGEGLQAAIGAVGNDEDRGVAAQIDHQAVRAIGLAGVFAFAAKAADIFGVFVVLMDEALAVAVGAKDVAVWSDGDIGGDKFLGHGVAVALFGSPFAPEFLAIEGGLGEDVATSVAHIEKFLATLAAEMKAVGAALVLRAPGADKFSVGVKDNDGVVDGGALADGVFDVNETVAIDSDAVGVAINVARGEFAPIVNHFVLVGAVADDGEACPGFVIG